MNSFIQEIINLLLRAPGNLVYHLVVTFSIAAALAISLNYWKSTDTTEGKRLVFGLAVLFLAQLAYFGVGALTWQGLINGSILLPPLDRFVTIVGLVLIAWMWIFPRSSRLGDAATLLLLLIVGAVFALSLVWWSGQNTQSEFNGTLPDQTISMLSLGIATIGMLLLAMRRQPGWGYGLAMVGVLLIGDVAHLTFPYPEGDLSGATRLAQLIAYPLLFLLPLRFPLIPPEVKPERQKTSSEQTSPGGEAARMGIDQQLFTLFVESGSADFYNQLVKLVAQQCKADLCILLAPPDVHGKMEILACYDLIRETYLGKAIFNSQSIPVIASALRRGRALRLPASSSSPDMVGLGKLLDMKSVGHLLAAPITNPHGDLLAGLVLLTPYSKRSWTSEDQIKMTEFAKPLAQVLQHQRMITELRKGQELAQAELQAVQQEREKYQKENRLLLERLGIDVESEEQQRAHGASLAALIVAHEEAQDRIARLQAENTRLAQDAQSLAGDTGIGSLDRATDSDNYQREITHVEGELRLALEEVARLNSIIYETDRKLLELQKELAGSSPSRKQMQEVAALAQELRQPLSSILGYTEFLLGETTGVLGTLQRRFMERIRISTTRMSGLVDELVRLTDISDNLSRPMMDAVDLSRLIDDAVAEASSQMRSKNIGLRLDVPKVPPQLKTNPAPLRNMLVTLLANAASVTPANGEIVVRVRLKGDENARDFVLIQVIDQGGGVKPEDLSRIFAPRYREENVLLQGVGENREGLSRLKSLAESLGGRIWVDTEWGTGSTFSLLLPLEIQLTAAVTKDGS